MLFVLQVESNSLHCIDVRHNYSTNRLTYYRTQTRVQDGAGGLKFEKQKEREI